jgi:hypothetical protein
MLSIHGKMLIQSFRQNILETYGLQLKVHQGFSMGQSAEDSSTVASARSESAGNCSGAFVLEGSMTVDQAEKVIKEALGFSVQILDKTGANAVNDANLNSVGFRLADDATTPRPAGEDASSSAIAVTGQKKLSTIQSEFTSRFNYLGLMFFSLEEAEKASQGLVIRSLQTDQTIARVRTKAAKGDLSIHGSNIVGAIEERFKLDYGLSVQVCCMLNGKPAYTGATANALTLSELNRRADEKGRGVFQYPTQ